MRTLYKDIRKIETSNDFIRHCAQYGATLHSCTDNDDLNDAVVLLTLEIGLIFLQTFGLEIISHEEKSLLDKFLDTQDQIPLWESSLQNLSKFMIAADKEKELQKIKETVEERVADYSKATKPKETHSEIRRNSFKLRTNSREVHVATSNNSLIKEYKPSSKEELAEIMNEFSEREEKFYNRKG